MIHLKKSFNRNIRKIIFVLPFMMTAYFVVCPAHAGISDKKHSFST
jgi:hypothetical protein